MASVADSPAAQRRSMCACADRADNWRGHGLSATYVCLCGGATVSATGLRWPPSAHAPDDGADPYREPDTDTDREGQDR